MSNTIASDLGVKAGIPCRLPNVESWKLVSSFTGVRGLGGHGAETFKGLMDLCRDDPQGVSPMSVYNIASPEIQLDKLHLKA